MSFGSVLFHAAKAMKKAKRKSAIFLGYPITQRPAEIN